MEKNDMAQFDPNKVSVDINPEKLREGYKQDKDKVRIDLVPMDVFLELAKLFTMGAKKYDDNNWKKGLRYGQVYAALMRHLIAFMEGDVHDPDNGQHHLDSVIWNAWVLRYMELHREKYKQFDDRPTKSLYLSIPDRTQFEVTSYHLSGDEIVCPEGWRFLRIGENFQDGDKVWIDIHKEFEFVTKALIGTEVSIGTEVNVAVFGIRPKFVGEFNVTRKGNQETD